MGSKRNTLIIADSFNILASSMLGPIYAIFVKKVGGGILETSSTAAVLAIIR